MAAQSDAFRLIHHCWRGGPIANFWRSSDKNTNWVVPDDLNNLPSGDDIYFGIHPCARIPDGEPKFVRSQKGIIHSINCLFAEFDAKDFADKSACLERVTSLHVPASIIIDSGGGYHCYWLLDEPFQIASQEIRDRVCRWQHQWVMWHGGDKGAKDLARVLRVPGTYNTKRAVKHQVCFVDNCFQMYAAQDLIAHLEADYIPECPKVSAQDAASAKSFVMAREQHAAAEARTIPRSNTITLFNQAFTASAILARNGYRINATGDRFQRPRNDGKTHMSGTIAVTHGKETVFSFSTGDQIFEVGSDGSGHRKDAFDLFMKLECGGDLKRALAEAGKLVQS